MKFFPDGPSLSDDLLARCDAGRVVFLCGAGVSFNSGMPTFLDLTKHVVEFFDPPEDSQIMAAFAPWLEQNSAANVPLDQIFNLLHQEYGRDEVNALVTQRLLVPPKSKTVGYEHSLIRRISSSQNGVPQIVTTNFDHLFEHGAKSTSFPIHIPPAFPDLAFGSPVEGITYLHGRLVSPDASDRPYVLSSADFGRAYLAEAWATKFISGLLERYTVVLVGYQAEDPPVKYLLQGLNHDGQFDSTRLYAFDRGLPEEIEAKWRDRGVSAIAYQDHEHLWKTMAAWAERTDDPRGWRSKVVSSAIADPKEMFAHERGQVAHILRSVPGAKIFADADPSPHPDWICVLDAFARNAKKSKDEGVEVKEFEPLLAYGLDDDLGPIEDEDFRSGIRNDNLIEWRRGDDNPPEAHKLGGIAARGHEALPARLWHLLRWIGKSIHSPTVAWWAVRQFGLHPRLIDHIEWYLDQRDDLDERCRAIWRLILEFQSDQRNREWDGQWFDLKKRLAADGWSSNNLREFRRMTRPMLSIKRPFGLHENMPTSSDWKSLSMEEIGQFSVKFLDRHNENLDVPDEVLPTVFAILEDQLSMGAELLSDIEMRYFTSPTCYPERETDGGDQYHDNSDEAFLQFKELFDRVVKLDPNLAKSHAFRWDQMDQFFFGKLKLYALAKEDIFTPQEVVSVILSLDNNAFWGPDNSRELLFAMIDRWVEFSEAEKNLLGDRILAGPNLLERWSIEEAMAYKDRQSARYYRYLASCGCDFPEEIAARLDAIVSRIPEWTDERARSTVIDRGVHGGVVAVDETPDEIIDLPVGEVLESVEAQQPREFSSLVEQRPFRGLVKANPRKALAALSYVARNGEYPDIAWDALIGEFPQEAPTRLEEVLLRRVLRLPHGSIRSLNHTLGRWLEGNLERFLERHEELAWDVYDHVVDGLLSGEPAAVDSGLGQVFHGGKEIHRSRRTFGHAINGPIGMCAEALIKAVPGAKQEVNSLIPAPIKNRIERLFASKGEGADHAVSVLLVRLNWVMHVDPEWANSRLIPMLAFDHPASEPAWSGFLHSPNNPTSNVAIAVKPLLLVLFPWIEQFNWGHDKAERAASWLAWMHIFRSGEPDGLDAREMRRVLRAMSERERTQLIFWLGRVGASNEDGWNTLVVPFINQVWPRERKFRTKASVTRWIGLLDDTKEDFPTVLKAVSKFLAPIESENLPLYRFTREIGGNEAIAVLHPQETLDLLDKITPVKVARLPYEFAKVLAIIEESAPDLTSSQRYLRLVELVESS